MPDTVCHSSRGRGDTVHFSDGDDLDRETIREISRVTWVGVAVNVALAIAKTAAGLWAGSMSLLADAVHTVSDLATDAAILVGVRYWSAPADAQHPHGHRKIETLVTLAIGLALAVVGIGLGCNAVADLVMVATGREAKGLMELNAATAAAFLAALASLAGKELLYRWTAAKGVKMRSSAVVANAWHHRSDAFSSIPPALAIGAGTVGSWYGRNLWYLDAIGALVVCVMLMQAAWEVVLPTLEALLDASADRQLCSAIRKTVLSTPGVIDAHKIRTRCIGPNAVAVDLHIQVSGSLTVAAGHDIAATVKYRVIGLRVSDKHQAVDVMVHVEPAIDIESVLRRGQESDTTVDWKPKE